MIRQKSLQTGKASKGGLFLWLSFLLPLLISTGCKTQKALLLNSKQVSKVKEDDPGDYIFVIYYKEASFPGGLKAWNLFLKQNLKYPQEAREAGIEGKVFLSFMVLESGKISDVEVVRGIGAGCDQEAIRVMRLSPLWTPAKQKGKVIASRMQIWFRFPSQKLNQF